MKTRVTLAVGITLLFSFPAYAQAATISTLKITTLSTMLTEFQGIGEWGFAALVEADGHRILFDTGARPDTVINNAQELGIDLSTVDTVILSHNHFDHTGGLVRLRRKLRTQRGSAVGTAHVGDGIFLPRVFAEGAEALPLPEGLVVTMAQVKEGYEALGGEFVIHKEPNELHPGIWVTGPIPRIHPEKNWSPIMRIDTEGGQVEDTIPEDQALVIHTTKGLVVVAGCGHAGIVNTMEYARKIADTDSVHAVVGGFHLLSLPDDKVAWTGNKMHEFGVEHVQGSHCTGINAVQLLRDSARLDRSTSVVGTVGSIYTLEDGIHPGLLTR